MTIDSKKPSEKVMRNPIDGLEVKDALGRVFRLRKPDLLDMYDLFSALGDDSKNPACLMLATKVLYVATIDGQVVECPKSYAQFRATLKRVGDEGISTIDDALMAMMDVKTEKEAIEKVKK